MYRLRPLKALIHDAVDATTLLVEEGHNATARQVVGALKKVPALAQPTQTVEDLRQAGTSGVLSSIRLVNRVVERVTDAALDLAPQAPAPAEAPPLTEGALWSASGAADQLVGLLNGAVGDHLEGRGIGFDQGMRLRIGSRWIDPDTDLADLTDLRPRLLVLVHGLGTNEASWSFGAGAGLGDPDATFGSLLAQDLGYTPIFVRYNTGLSVQANGERLARALEQLSVAWPLPIERIDLVGHSMGGLVCRAATHAAGACGYRWPRRLRKLAGLGSPHRGAPLARLGHHATRLLRAVDLPATQILGRILDGRSEGVKELRHTDPASAGPLLQGVDYAFFAGAAHRDPAHPVSGLMGDWIVPLQSAQGPLGADGAPRVLTRRFGGVGHHQLQTDLGLYLALRAFLADGGPALPPPTVALDT